MAKRRQVARSTERKASTKLKRAPAGVDQKKQIATLKQSPYLNNLIAARPGPNRTRLTLFNSRFNVRFPSGEVDRRTISGVEAFRDVLTNEFGLSLSEFELRTAIVHMEQRRTPGAPHPFFA
jgi:N-hydroxyarylamine O-acetyltransferase